MRIPALDELNGMFERDVVCSSKQEVNMFRHYNECVKLESSFAAISVESLQKEADVILDYEQLFPLPR